jgi:putative protease
LSQSESRKPELLAPAGSVDSLRAAVASGADAVYLGLDELNARRGAQNFTVDALAEACRFAHLHGTRVYLTANVVILPGELARALSMVDAAWSVGVDAVIVQDMGLLRAVRRAMPHVRLHASTQMNVHGSDTLEALAQRGVSRVTLARETSLQEIAGLVSTGRRVGLEIESFVHGALCVCYSGQCLLSSLVGGRSANRGQCAQPCRLPYELLDADGEKLSDVGQYLLSPKDLAGITVLPAFVDSGVTALKIEGRMKSAEYVALVTGVYRSALDRAFESPETYEVRDGELSVLSEAFSRGFTEAYLRGESGSDMMSYRRPNNRGVSVGRVVDYRGGRATIALETAVDSDDTIEFWTSQGRFAQRVGPLDHGGATHASAAAGTKAVISVEGATSRGDRVFRVRNAALSAAASRLYSPSQGPAIPLEISARVIIGQPVRVEVIDSQTRSGAAEGVVVELARTRAVTAEDITEHVGRLGGTAYRAASWDVELSPKAGIGFSALHAVRRAALSDYESSVLAEWKDRRVTRPALPPIPSSRRAQARHPRLVASVSDLRAARACLAAGADEVHVPSWVRGVGVLSPQVVPVVPRICHDAERRRLVAPAEQAGVGVAGTLGSLAALSEKGCVVQAHWSLNAVNAHSVAELADMGASAVWLSPELTLHQVAAVIADSVVPVGIAVAGRQELMVTEHCVLTSEGPCSGVCETCTRRTSDRVLRDRKGYRFPVVTDPTGRTHLYNSIPLDLTAALHEVIEVGPSALRLDLETESAERAATEVARVRSALEATRAGRFAEKPDTPVTSGHFFRGIR